MLSLFSHCNYRPVQGRSVSGGNTHRVLKRWCAVAAGFETRIVRAAMSKTTRKTYSPQFKMKVALEVAKEQEMLFPVAAKHGESLSLAAS